MLSLNSFCFCQTENEIDRKFNWAIKTLDRWLIDNQPVCDACPDSLTSITVDSTTIEFDYENKMVRMTDIFDALTIVSTVTEIEPTIKFSLGTFGISCIDCSTYEQDRKNWIEWFAKNKSKIDQEKINKLKTVHNKS